METTNFAILYAEQIRIDERGVGLDSRLHASIEASDTPSSQDLKGE
jgi:hypothetical protein